MPIVCVPDTDEAVCGFLVQRLVGTRDDPYWAWQLYDFCSAAQRSATMDWTAFPLPLAVPASTTKTRATVAEQLERLPHESPTKELRERLLAWFAELQVFTAGLVKQASVNDEKPPHASFALESYVEGRLADLTAGTRDSELHFVRALGTLYDAYADEPHTQAAIWEECAPALVRALIYLFGQVACDADEGLPRGADSRDIFSDALEDARLLSNACFLHQVFNRLAGWSHLWIGGAFYAAMLFNLTDPTTAQLVTDARNKSTFLDHLLATVMAAGGDKPAASTADLKRLVSDERDKLAGTIRRVFFPSPGHCDPTASPRDFVPGARATTSFVAPVKASPSNHLVLKYEPAFVHGTVLDPQGVALALLQDLVPAEWITPQIGCRQVRGGGHSLVARFPLSPHSFPLRSRGFAMIPL
jgi:hypothetical protein